MFDKLKSIFVVKCLVTAFSVPFFYEGLLKGASVTMYL